MRIVDHDPLDRLQEASRGYRNTRAWPRVQAIILAKQGDPAPQIARALGAGQIIATTRSAAKHDLPNSLDWQPHSRLASTMRRRSDPATPTGGEEQSHPPKESS